MTFTYITVNSKYQIEVVNESGNYYPMHKADGRFYYFHKGNKQINYKTEKGARKCIADRMALLGETQEQLEVQETTTPEPVQEDEELFPEDITALEEALAQPTLGPYTMQELEQMVAEAQVQQNLIKFFQAAYDYCYTIVPDYLPQPHEYIYGSVNRPMSPSWARIPEAHYVQVDWHTNGYVHTWVVVPQPLDAKMIANYELKLVRVPETLQVAWDSLQSTPSYFERKLEDDRTSDELWHDMQALQVKIAQELAIA